MKNVFLFLALVITSVAILVSFGVAYVLYGADRTIADAFSRTASQALKVPVSIGTASFALSDGENRLTAVQVANPPGFGAGPAIEIPMITWQTNPRFSSAELTYVDRLVIDGARVTLEISGETNNLNLLNSAIGAFGSLVSPSARPVIIKEIMLSGGTVTLRAESLGAATSDFPLPDSRVRNVGSPGAPVSHAEIATALADLTMSAVERATRRLDINTGLPVAGDRPPALRPR
jgi:hypothetical protein